MPATKASVIALAQAFIDEVNAIPAPVVPPPVVPPPVATTQVTRKALVGRLITAPGFFGGGQGYNREQYVVDVRILTGTYALTARSFDNAALSAVPFSLELRKTDGSEQVVMTLGPVTPAAGANNVTFSLTKTQFDALAEGWYWQVVTGAGVGTSIDYPLYIRKNALAAPQTMMPVCTGSYTLEQMYTNNNPAGYQRAMVPAQLKPVTQPLKPKAYPKFTGTPRRDRLVQVQIAPYHPEDEYRTCVTATGIINTANHQNYFYYDFSSSRTWWELLVGARGEGSIICPLEIVPTERPPAADGTTSTKMTVIEPRRAVSVDSDGTIRMLLGEYTVGLPTHWADTPQVAFYGQWDPSVPLPLRVHPGEMWGWYWIDYTLPLDTTVPPIGTPPEPPHLRAPEARFTSTLNGYIGRVVYSKDTRGLEPTIHIDVSGLNKPWGIAGIPNSGGEWCHTEQGANLFTVRNADNTVKWTVPVAEATGLRVRNGIAYVGSLPNKAIIKIDLATRAIVGQINLSAYWINNNSRYIVFDISDGSFGPVGMIALATWSNISGGCPLLLNPDGSMLSPAEWYQGGAARPGIPWAGESEKGLSYVAACAFGKNGNSFLVWGTAQEGLQMVVGASATDVAPPAAYWAGQSKWALDWELTHAKRGFGYYGLPLPWGVDPDIDVYLTWNGHVKV